MGPGFEPLRAYKEEDNICLPLFLYNKEQKTLMLTFFSFGSGSCGNCYYISTGTDAIIVDAGVGIRRFKKNVREYGLNTSIIRGVLITHDHADHIKNAGLLSNEYHVPVYATAPVHEGINRNYQVKNKVDGEYARTITPDESFEVGPFKATPFLLPHDASQNVGYMLEIDDTTFTVMTDVGAVTDNVSKYIRMSHNLVIEANYDTEMLKQGRYPAILKQRICSGNGHLANTQTAEALSANFHENLKRVWLCHLSEENNHPELARKTIDTHLRSFGIIAGVDFQLEVLRRKIPTGPFNL